MNEQPTSFPCPKCGVARGEGGIACLQCGWEPDPIRTQQSVTIPSRSSGWGCLGIAIIVLSVILISPLSLVMLAILGLNNHDATALEKAFIAFFALGRYIGSVGILFGIVLCVIGFSKPQK